MLRIKVLWVRKTKRIEKIMSAREMNQIQERKHEQNFAEKRATNHVRYASQSTGTVKMADVYKGSQQSLQGPDLSTVFQALSGPCTSSRMH